MTNDWVGRVIGVLTLTPYGFWRRTHAIHHATTGNLDRRGIGDVDTLTVQEYRARSSWGRLHIGFTGIRWSCSASALPICSFSAAFAGRAYARWLATLGQHHGDQSRDRADHPTFVWLIGIKAFLLVHLPIMLLAGRSGCGCSMCSTSSSARHGRMTREWNLHVAALHGSSHYDLPAFLRWFTANIGVHHVHHLCSRIPYYRLPGAARASGTPRSQPADAARKLSLRAPCLWDETQRRLVSFRDVTAPE